MKVTRTKTFPPALNVAVIAVIVVCFLASMINVREYAKDECFQRIEETTTQVAHMFTHAMNERQDKLRVFADILAANDENPDELLQVYMSNFCKTQYFSALCIHRANGRVTAYGAHPHGEKNHISYETETGKIPYISEVFSFGDTSEEKIFYQAVPIIRNGDIIAVLYGYTTMNVLPSFIASGAYDGQCQFYVVDGNTGDFLMDDYHGTLGNIYDGSMGNRETKLGYTMEEMCAGVQSGEKGYYVFRSQKTGEWYYTYYMPLGLNNWSMQMTIDEPTAFAAYDEVNDTVLRLMVATLVLLSLHVAILMAQTAQSNRSDRERLHKSRYVNAVQAALMNAHNKPDFVDHALELVAGEMRAETVMLLSFADTIISRIQFWPMEDEPQAMNLLDRDIREDFPVFYGLLSSKQSVFHDCSAPALSISPFTMELLERFDVSKLALVPIMDTSGRLKGALAAINPQRNNCEMLTCVTYDFFMALTNLENHTIITNMGTMDYLTQIKNRNSYEADLSGYATMDGESLWCVFIDVNGLHEVNNSLGHKMGDVMLCTVAEAVKSAFGEKHTYRVGGDEFVAFVLDSTHQKMMDAKERMSTKLAEGGYYVSVGFEGIKKNENGLFDVEQVVSQAEAIMYKDKRAYYQENHLPPDRGHFPAEA